MSGLGHRGDLRQQHVSLGDISAVTLQQRRMLWLPAGSNKRWDPLPKGLRTRTVTHSILSAMDTLEQVPINK